MRPKLSLSAKRFKTKFIASLSSIAILHPTILGAAALGSDLNKLSGDLVANFGADSSAKASLANLKLKQQVAHFSAAPSDDELTSQRILPEPLSPTSGAENTSENKQLAAALALYVSAKDHEKTQSLEAFLRTHPKSRWYASLALNIGLLRDETGHISDSLTYYGQAWERAKAETGGRQRAVADRAFGELALADSRNGRVQDLEELLNSAQGRTFTGSMTERLKRVRYNLWMMKNKPAEAFKCGPYALSCLLNKHDKAFAQAMNEIKNATSSPKGMNLYQLAQLAQATGLELQAAKRISGAKVIVPAIFHWKVGHYAALTSEKNGKYYLRDPTYDVVGHTALSKDAFEAESDGYFLVPQGSLPSGWKTVSQIEAEKVWGRADAGAWGSEKSCDTPQLQASIANYSCKTCFGAVGVCPPVSESSCKGMTKASIYAMQATLHVEDAPLAYTPPIGPPISFLATYNQDEVGQPANFSFTNITQDWSLNWCSYLSVDASQNVVVRVRGGGTEVYAYSPPADNFSNPNPPNLYSQAQIFQAGGGTYQRILPDGKTEIFGLTDTSGNYDKP